MQSRPGRDVLNVVYHGYRCQPVQQLIVIESAAGGQIGVLRHVARHSPSGLNWGYLGSGPLDTARSLLIDALGERAVCPVCRGSTRVVFLGDDSCYRAEPFDPIRHPWSRRGWPCQCSDGYEDLPYGDFTEQFVARWGNDWRISRASILDWLSARDEAARTEAAEACGPLLL